MASSSPQTTHARCTCAAVWIARPAGAVPLRAGGRTEGGPSPQPAARYEQAIAENPGTTFVLGHSGALQHETAIRFAERYPNTYFELSCLGLGALREVLDTVPPNRILYGTDWPFYHQALTLARVLIATEGDTALRRSVLHDNAVRLFDLDV